jgi:hypothetical protein
MKLAPPLALGLVIALSAAVVSPAYAGDDKPKKEKKEKGGKPATKVSISPKYAPVYMAAKKAIDAKDLAGATAALDAGAGNAQTPYDKYVSETLYFQIAATKNDRKGMKAHALGSLASGGAPVEDQGRLNWVIGILSYEENDFTNAAKYLTEAERMNHGTKDYVINIADSYFKLGNFAAGSAALDRAIAASNAAGKKPPETWYRVALRESMKVKDAASSAKWTTAYIRAYPTPQVWNMALSTYRDFSKLDPQLQLDVFRLMYQTGALSGAQDYFDYAAIATERGLPGEAKRILDEGFAKGAISKTMPQLRERLADAEAKIPADRASLPNEEKKAAASADGKASSVTANAYLAYGENEKAVTFYDMALKKGGAIDANAVNLRKGIALTKLGRKSEARQAFGLVAGSQKDLAGMWILYLDLNP